MRHLTLWSALILIAAAGGRPLAAPPTPVIVELFTSEGCSSCPPADELLARMAAAPALGDAIVVPLGEHVDYWDRLGWRDRFSSAAFTARQEQYARRLAGDGPYTPQLVIDGRAECVGSDVAAARRAIAGAAARPHGTVAIDLATDAGSSSAGRLRVVVRASGLPQKAGEHADVLVAITEGHLSDRVTAGENRGRLLSHTAVVRHLAIGGEAVGASGVVESSVALAPEWRRDALQVVAFVQERRTGAVLAAAAAPLVPHP
jgi:hypothetical protein